MRSYLIDQIRYCISSTNQNSSYCQYLSILVNNRQKSSKVVKACQNLSELVKVRQSSSKLVKTRQSSSKFVQDVRTHWARQNSSKLVKTRQNSSKLVKVVKTRWRCWRVLTLSLVGGGPYRESHFAAKNMLFWLMDNLKPKVAKVR